MLSIHLLRCKKTMRGRVSHLSISSWRILEIWMCFSSTKRCLKKSKKRKRTTLQDLRRSKWHKSSTLMQMLTTKMKNQRSLQHQLLSLKAKMSNKSIQRMKNLKISLKSRRILRWVKSINYLAKATPRLYQIDSAKVFQARSFKLNHLTSIWQR